MRTVYILKGLPASGKTTWAKERIKDSGFKRVNKDDLREMIDDRTKHDKRKFSKNDEKLVLRIRDHVIVESLKDGKHVIVDDTNLSDKHYRRIKQLVKENFPDENIQVTVKEFDVPLEECIKRDLQRCDSVGESVIREMHDTHIRPPIKLREQDVSLFPAIIVDMDGTLADNSKRNPYDASTAHNDGLIEEVADVVRRFSHDHEVIIVSARIERHRVPTERFLEIHEIPYNKLILRKNDDTRKDAIVKREMFEEHIEDKYFVRFVIDDRTQVVRMWRELGFRVFQCAEGNF